MLMLISYDVSTVTPEGRARLRRIAKTCLDYGQRVQNSVFECVVDQAQWLILRAKLLELMNKEEDSLRFYRLGGMGQRRVEHHGIKQVPDLERDTLVM